MASAASILAAGNPSLLVAVPGAKAPTLLNVRATIGGTGVATVVSTTSANGIPGTTPGVSIARVSAGVYDITFPACRAIWLGTLTGSAGSVSAGAFVAADARYIVYDKSTTNTNATTGKLRVAFATGASVTTELGNGQEVNVSFWADLG